MALVTPLGGVTRRFPRQRFTFSEGMVHITNPITISGVRVAWFVIRFIRVARRQFHLSVQHTGISRTRRTQQERRHRHVGRVVDVARSIQFVQHWQFRS